MADDWELKFYSSDWLLAYFKLLIIEISRYRIKA